MSHDAASVVIAAEAETVPILNAPALEPADTPPWRSKSKRRLCRSRRRHRQSPSPAHSCASCQRRRALIRSGDRRAGGLVVEQERVAADGRLVKPFARFEPPSHVAAVAHGGAIRRRRRRGAVEQQRSIGVSASADAAGTTTRASHEHARERESPPRTIAALSPPGRRRMPRIKRQRRTPARNRLGRGW